MPNVTCLCIGDPHFRIDNMEDATIFVGKCVELAKKRKPTFIVCLGDLIHHKERA